MDPHTKLWHQVLLLALEDAADGHGADYIRTRDFDAVCAFADFDADYVRDRWHAGLIPLEPPKGARRFRPGK